MFLMGTDIDITVFWETDCSQDVENIFDLFKALEIEFSRFLEESSLSFLNKKKSIEVSNTFIEVMNICKKLYEDTHWYFNPLVNLGHIGYSKSFDLKQFIKDEQDEINIDFDKVQIEGNTVTLDENQILDLGWIVKWFAVDLARKQLDKKGYTDYIINAWGDIYCAWYTETGQKILVGIDNPTIPWILLATLEIHNQAIATSGNYKRKRTIDDEEYTHIINPLTGENNREINSITLIADDCYIADAYATVCIAMWLEKALKFIKEEKIEGLIICADWNIYQTDWMMKYNVQILL